MGRKALVIGGAGFLGAGIVQELCRANFEPVVLGRGNKPAPADVPFVQADRHDLDEMKAIARRGWDVVVDCAAFGRTDVAGAIEDFEGRAGHYILISSDFVYAARPEHRDPIDEDAPKQQVQPYGRGKLDCERVLLAEWERDHFPVTVLRPPHILGHGKPLGCEFGQMRDVHLLEHLRTGKGLVLTEGGGLLVQPVWHREVGRCIAHIAGMHSAFGGVFNIAGGECVPTRQYYQIIADLMDVELRFDSISLAETALRKPDIAPVAGHRAYDLGRLRAATGYAPQLCLREAIAETYDWMLQQRQQN